MRIKILNEIFVQVQNISNQKHIYMLYQNVIQKSLLLFETSSTHDARRETLLAVINHGNLVINSNTHVNMCQFKYHNSSARSYLLIKTTFIIK